MIMLNGDGLNLKAVDEGNTGQSDPSSDEW